MASSPDEADEFEEDDAAAAGKATRGAVAALPTEAAAAAAAAAEEGSAPPAAVGAVAAAAPACGVGTWNVTTAAAAGADEFGSIRFANFFYPKREASEKRKVGQGRKNGGSREKRRKACGWTSVTWFDFNFSFSFSLPFPPFPL